MNFYKFDEKAVKSSINEASKLVTPAFENNTIELVMNKWAKNIF